MDYVTGINGWRGSEPCIKSEADDVLHGVRNVPEIVFTGRGPAQWMLDSADYITVMKAERHPYEQGVRAREGIEF